jgi:hypothetical protein
VANQGNARIEYHAEERFPSFRECSLRDRSKECAEPQIAVFGLLIAVNLIRITPSTPGRGMPRFRPQGCEFSRLAASMTCDLKLIASQIISTTAMLSMINLP